ncbi:hypothetical protein Scep_003139 [Stephania cephalantha]|uniref:C2H2-type domain-containing protein n=1 Tax=Stephania cephalantha TaxID=152367 RepID=A0AAP0PVK0_9MAGN
MESDGGGGEEEKRRVIFRDVRRYYCDYCGICRSKKSLIAAHVLANHKDEMEEKEADCGDCGEDEETVEKKNTCEECGASFRKPAYLKQHMRGHMLERPFACPVDDCHSSYRRKDHLTRHLLQHQGKLFSCPVPDCKSSFSYQGNMTRHVKEHHDEDDDLGSCDEKGPQQHACQEEGCGKVFKFASRLRKHEETHGKFIHIFLTFWYECNYLFKLDTIEAVCCEPDCMKVFTNSECLKAHIQACHQHITCEICGSKQPKKNFKRHMLVHEGEVTSTERIKCSFEGCQYTFATKSNLNQHVKAVHLELRPFVCRVGGCGKKFPYRHVRDNHEKSHEYVQGDFLESDAQFQSRTNRGGRKRKSTSAVEMLQRKRIVLPGQMDSAIEEPSDYIAWLLTSTTEDQQ